MKKGVYIVIPAYNEEKYLGEVLDDLKEAGWHNILVVNDGSRDNTETITQVHGIDVITLLINRGQGAALAAGINYLKQYKKPEVIVTYDADGQHTPSDVQALIQPILDGKADVTLGSRFLKPTSRIPFVRKLILKAGVFFTIFMSNIYVTDTHNGLRAFSPKAYQSLRLSRRGMEHASEIIDEVKRHHWRFKEVPVTIKYSLYSQKKGQRVSGFVKLGIKYLLSRITT